MAEAELQTPALLSRKPAQSGQPVGDREVMAACRGRVAARLWVREVLAPHQLESVTDGKLMLADATARSGPFGSTRVSFWLCHDKAGDMRAMIAEVNNTYGDPAFLSMPSSPTALPFCPATNCRRARFSMSRRFQPVEGDYSFHVEMTDAKVNIRIGYRQECRG